MVQPIYNNVIVKRVKMKYGDQQVSPSKKLPISNMVDTKYGHPKNSQPEIQQKREKAD